MPKSTNINIYDKVQYWTIDNIGIPLCVFFHIHPNTVTLLGFIPIFCQYLSIKYCDRPFIHLFAMINYWFDCVDGELARQTNQVSKIGGILDTIHDTITGIMLLYFIDYRLILIAVIILTIVFKVFGISLITHTVTNDKYKAIYYLIHDNLIIFYLIINEIIIFSQGCYPWNLWK